jgi:hypothetical protein
MRRVNLSEFLTARLDEDEQIARAINGDKWGWPGARSGFAAHVARHDPARVLREVAAKRAILAECARSVECGDDGCVLAGAVIVNMAAIWGDHPDYGEAVRPA